MKKETKTTKKESNIEMLARLVADGFEKMEREFSSVKQELSFVQEEVSSVKQEVSSLKEEMNIRFEDVEIRLTNINLEQKETNRRLDTIERHQKGMLESLDETVHRNEFARLEKRVKALEQ